MAIYAVIECGGKQYQVNPGDVIDVEKMDKQIGDQIVIDRVLLVSRDGDVQIGKPVVKSAKVLGKIVQHGKAKKIDVVNYKAKKNIKRKIGHRQEFTRLKIESVEC